MKQILLIIVVVALVGCSFTPTKATWGLNPQPMPSGTANNITSPLPRADEEKSPPDEEKPPPLLPPLP